MEARRVLVLGGTQFMGRLLVERLLKERFDVTVLNRGVTPNPFEADLVHSLHVDRLQDREGFRRMLRSSGRWFAVVDFIAFEACHISDVVEALREEPKKRKADETSNEEKIHYEFRTQHYFFISTDSVFVGCAPSKQARRTEQPDELSLLPDHELKQVAAREAYQTRYGAGKRSCEGALRDAFERWGFPFIALRLPDVVGPFDNLGCHLQIQTAIIDEQLVGLKCAAPGMTGRSYEASVVFAPDVIEVIWNFMLPRDSSLPSPFGEVFHVCCDESITLETYAKEIAKCLSGESEGKDEEQDDKTAKKEVTEEVSVTARFSLRKPAIFLCVEIGVLDNSKVKRYLKSFAFTSLKKAIWHTTEWNLTAQNALYTLKLSSEET